MCSHHVRKTDIQSQQIQRSLKALPQILRLCNQHRRLQRHQLPLGIALVDIDHFKKYNDHYGHIAGDGALSAVASALELATKRPGEMVARYGGEEFVVLLPQVNEAILTQYGQLICNAVQALQIPHGTSETSPWVTISVGLASLVPTSDSSPVGLLERADSALYLAKERGRNRYELFR